MTKSDANFASVELPNKAISQRLALTDGRPPPIIDDEEFPLDLDWHSGLRPLDSQTTEFSAPYKLDRRWY
jgi:hypothetical protein